MKRLTLIRDAFTEKSTMGTLSVDGGYFCETLEDRTRAKGVKIPGETCIPEGLYQIELITSPKRGYLVPLLIDVPMFSAIEIHIGNTPEDTRGCILVARARGIDRIIDSTSTFHHLMTLLDNDEDITINIVSNPEKLKEAGLA